MDQAIMKKHKRRLFDVIEYGDPRKAKHLAKTYTKLSKHGAAQNLIQLPYQDSIKDEKHESSIQKKNNSKSSLGIADISIAAKVPPKKRLQSVKLKKVI